MNNIRTLNECEVRSAAENLSARDWQKPITPNELLNWQTRTWPLLAQAFYTFTELPRPKNSFPESLSREKKIIFKKSRCECERPNFVTKN